MPTICIQTHDSVYSLGIEFGFLAQKMSWSDGCELLLGNEFLEVVGMHSRYSSYYLSNS